jgi:hypothetical protein
MRSVKAWRAIFACASGVVLAGCATHPLQDDVTRLKLDEVINKIRCEAADAVRKHDPLSEFDAAVLVFNFRFVITETDEADTAAKFVFPVGAGKLSFGVDAGKTLVRAGDREVKLTEQFKLFRDMTCLPPADGHRTAALYPITGNVGLDEVVRNFISIASIHNRKSYGFMDTYKDIITFTTTIGAGADIKLTPVSSKLTEVGGSVGVTRVDKHELRVEFSPPPPPPNHMAWRNKVQAVQLVSGVLKGAEGPSFEKSADISKLRQAIKDLEAKIANNKAAVSQRELNLSTQSNQPGAQTNTWSAFADREKDAIKRDKENISELEESVRAIKRQVNAPPSTRAYAPSTIDQDALARERASEKAYRNQILDAQRDLRDFVDRN